MIMYTNGVSIATSLYDFNIRFYCKGPKDKLVAGDTEEEIVESNLTQYGEPAVIIMSPQHAKSLLQILEGQISAYEESFGVIPVDPEDEIVE